MATKMLTIDGITFPDFGDDKSKKNFRPVFYMLYKGKDKKMKTTIVAKPAEGAWQWRKADKKFFLSGTDIGDSVELDTSALRFDDPTSGFTSTDHQIAEIDGKLSSIAVQFVDVGDSSFGSFFGKNIMPQLVGVWKTTGFNPIDLLPVPGIVTGIVKDNIKLDDLADKAANFLANSDGDKVLHRISKNYDGKGKKPFVISGTKEWKQGKTGTYAVTIGFE